MANHKSAIKRIRQTEKRNNLNRASRTALRTQIKKFVTAMDAGEGDKAKELFPPTVSIIDRTVRKGAMAKGTANRMKSRLSARLKKSATA